MSNKKRFDQKHLTTTQRIKIEKEVNDGLSFAAQTFQNICTLAGFGNISVCAEKTAACSGAEWNDRLAGKIIVFDERINRHRHIAPPNRIADKNHIII